MDPFLGGSILSLGTSFEKLQRFYAGAFYVLGEYSDSS
jgi:hypothetical protein